jgi:hypothetical protein
MEPERAYSLAITTERPRCASCRDIGGTTKESGQFQSTDVMDVYSVGWVFYDIGPGAYVLDCIGHCHSNHCVQRSHCISQCSCKREKDPLFQSSKLVWRTGD